MKFVKYLLIAITSIVFISACQKELDFTTDGLAHGSLKSGGAGDCLPSVVNGIFKADSLLDNTSYIDVTVNLEAVGAYDIKSDTVNGYSFRGTGNLGVTGINTVRLYASGKPLVSGINNFTIIFDTTHCVISVSVIGANTGVAVFTLNGSPGLCANATVQGIYTEGIPLDITNTLTLTINVVDTGVYTIAAASTNGMIFSSAGVFTTFGIQSVTLNGSGTPQSSGQIEITATNIATTCTYAITVLASGTSTAVYTLDVNGPDCFGATYAGTYTQGVPLTGSNVVLLNVSVTTIGSYSITTNTVNGMSFSASGTFTATGPQQPITLVGSGTPTAIGAFNFTATAGTSTCIFSVSVFAGTNEEYIPETAFSNWSDRLVGGTATDTSYIQVSPNTIVLNSITYKIFEIKDLGVAVDSSFHHSNGGKYYQLYNDAFGFFDSPFNKDGMLLDSSLNVNDTWTTDLGANTFNTLPATGSIDCKILAKGVTATIAGNTYTNIIKVGYTFNYDLGSGNTAYATEDIWYAKGKGVVYDKFDHVPVTTTMETETTRIQIF